MNKFYLTTAIPYVNAKPHVGHALEFVQADAIKRFRQSLGEEVLLLSGADENALKNVQAAEAANTSVQDFIDTHSQEFEELARQLNINFDVFQRGSAKEHHLASQKLWELCNQNGDIYKKTYTGLYCVGCELFYEKAELNENGECFEHPGKPLEEVSEENYFFKLSKYQQQIEDLISSNKLKIFPEFRKNEVLSFLKEGLKDISISRSNERARNWGVTVPNDENQKMYVWFDALNIYASGVGFESNPEMYSKWWPADLHIIGKGIIRFHAIYWIAFLLSAKLQLPKALFVHGYFTVEGQKMSKTLGNVVDPIEIINKYGEDVLRYYFLSEMSPFSDGDFSIKRLEEVYNSDLANGIGNLVARVAKLCETAGFKSLANPKSIHLIDISDEYKNLLEEYKLNEAIALIKTKISKLDKYINESKPWELLKISENHKGRELNLILAHAVDQIIEIAILLEPFTPKTSEKIKTQFQQEEIKSDKPLFPRI